MEVLQSSGGQLEEEEAQNAVQSEIILKIVTTSGVTLDLRTDVHLGRACRFTYAVR